MNEPRNNTAHDPPKHPPPLSLTERIERVRAVIDTLRDSMQLSSTEFSGHFYMRAVVCDLVADELASIATEIGG